MCYEKNERSPDDRFYNEPYRDSRFSMVHM